MTELEPHDVVEIEVNGETHTGVVRNADDDSVKIELERHAVSETVDTEDLWAEDDTAYVVPELVTFVGRPDTETLHPQNYSVEQHVERLETEDEDDEETEDETTTDETGEEIETAEDVEEFINVLLQRGLSPGQAWAYYGVEVREHSRNEWSKKCGYSDHSAVSEPLRKAMEKLENDRFPTCPNCGEAVRIDGADGLECMECGTDIQEGRP